MTAPVTEGSSGGWLFKNKEHGKASAAASLVMIKLYSACFEVQMINTPIACLELWLIRRHLLGFV